MSGTQKIGKQTWDQLLDKALIYNRQYSRLPLPLNQHAYEHFCPSVGRAVLVTSWKLLPSAIDVPQCGARLCDMES